MTTTAHHGVARLPALLIAMLLAASCSTVSTLSAPAGTSAPMTVALAQAETLARNDVTLTGQAREANRARIEQLLAAIDNSTLAREAAALPAGDPLYNFAGHALLNRGLGLPRAFDQSDLRFGASDRPAADSDGYRPPLKVGVLLPLSGELSKAAVPVRDGLLAGYYAEHRRRPDIQFYD
ncbi:MAG: LppC family lipoprotein, partial [Xanthomonadaceae bacterium]|nr:LppC family lipoprotein [Xanthomonadaceae bacterium]